MSLLKRLWKEDEGQDLVEYGLLIVLVGLVCITALNGLAAAINDMFSGAVLSLTNQS